MSDMLVVSVDHLLNAAKAVTLTFDRIPSEPVPVADESRIADPQRREIADRYRRHGFAIIRIAGRPVRSELLRALSRSLDMGAPFVPPLYRMGGRAAPDISRISAASNAGTADAGHPSFGRTIGQRLHTDGTLEKLGHVRSTLLLCESPAAEGGETILFNSSAAYARLAVEDPRAAIALAAQGVLIRQANINGCADENRLPAFTVQDGHLVCGYSVTETDRWSVPDRVDEADLKRGIAFLSEAAEAPSPYFRSVTLDAGEAIVFDNGRISHGRTAYQDSATRRRCLYRSLHLRHPLGAR